MYDETAADEVTNDARAARDAITNLTHATQRTPELLPTDIANTVENLAELVAALPQLCNQLGAILQATLRDQLITMDSMTDVSDPRVAIGAAQQHLDQAREQAVELYKSLDGAHQLTAHLISHGTST